MLPANLTQSPPLPASGGGKRGAGVRDVARGEGVAVRQVRGAAEAREARGGAAVQVESGLPVALESDRVLGF
jgi:hypothetical protein